MAQGRQYVPLDPTKGGGIAAFILALAIAAAVTILAISIFLGVRLASIAGQDIPLDPLPAPIPPVNVSVTSKIQMALLFLHAQKSGNLTAENIITWRNSSGMEDGADINRDLTGGFYDGGGTVKYNFPMAYSMTMLSWAYLEYFSVFKLVDMDGEVRGLIKWGVDYLLKTRYQDIIFTQVGEPELDELCWTRPEDEPPSNRRTPYPCDVSHPCSDVAGEYAAALSSASLVFQDLNPGYAKTLLQNAEEIFKFGDTYRGKYSDWNEAAQVEYNSTGYGDELMWGATWLFFASGKLPYLNYLTQDNTWIWKANQWKPSTNTFDWDRKMPGVQVLLSRLLLLGYGIGNTGQIPQVLEGYLNAARLYVCQYTPHWKDANFTTSGQLIWQGTEDHPLEYAINAAFLSTVLTDYLRVSVSSDESSRYMNCDSTLDSIVSLAMQQADYVLGSNPLNMSYMVGFGETYPTRVYHKGASIPNKRSDGTNYTCDSGKQFLSTSNSNPNLLVGAVVGGPDVNDGYNDDRLDLFQSEPKLYINAVWAGLLAALGAPVRPGNSLTRMWVNLPWAKKFASMLENYATSVPKGGSHLPPLTPPPPPDLVFNPVSDSSPAPHKKKNHKVAPLSSPPNRSPLPKLKQTATAPSPSLAKKKTVAAPLTVNPVKTTKIPASAPKSVLVKPLKPVAAAPGPTLGLKKLKPVPHSFTQSQVQQQAKVPSESIFNSLVGATAPSSSSKMVSTAPSESKPVSSAPTKIAPARSTSNVKLVPTEG